VTPRVVVVGGGISGLAAAWRLHLRRPEVNLTVVEAAQRWGGKLVTWNQDGCLVEGGADGFLARKPPALAWAEELGLGPELVEPEPLHRQSQVWFQGRLYPLPAGFSGLVPTDLNALRASSLLSPEGAERAIAEATLAAHPEGPEESVHEFFARRYGEEAWSRLLEPLLVGIFAGDGDALSASAAFPQLVELERRGLSLSGGAARPQPGAAFRSFRRGMAQWPQALERTLRAASVDLRSGLPVQTIERRGAAWVVTTASGGLEADAVIVALPPRAAGSVLALPEAASVLSTWPVASVAHLTLGLDAEGWDLPPGSGLVCAGASPFSAVTWLSRKWPYRAPASTLTARFYFGGARDPKGWQRPEVHLEADALAFLAPYSRGKPHVQWRRVFRWKDGFAQPNLGHAERHRRLAQALPPGLVLAGAYFTGVGIPDSLARAETAAEAVDRFLTTGETSV